MRKEPQANAGNRKQGAGNREEPQGAADPRSLQGEPERATPDGMADELITFAEAGRRLPKPDGAPRSVRTMQDWAARGLIAVETFSPHARLVNWTRTLRRLAGKGVTIPGEGNAPDTDTEE